MKSTLLHLKFFSNLAQFESRCSNFVAIKNVSTIENYCWLVNFLVECCKIQSLELIPLCKDNNCIDFFNRFTCCSELNYSLVKTF